MVFLSQANDCLCGAFAGMRRSAMSGKPTQLHSKGLMAAPPVPPPTQLPTSMDLPARLASALHSSSSGTDEQCALGGVIGPILATMLGVADGLGFDEAKRMRLHVACRRELRHLTRAVMGKQAWTPKPAPTSGEKVTAKQEDTFNVLLGWCSTPAMPTYSVGVRLALGLVQEDDPLLKLAADLAWVFRLLCVRARISNSPEAPMLFAACEVLCSGKEVSGGLGNAIEVGLKGNRSESLMANLQGALNEEQLRRRFNSSPNDGQSSGLLMRQTSA